MGSSCDNVDVSVTTGDIWTGCHPVAHILYLNGYMTTPSQSTAPAQVSIQSAFASNSMFRLGSVKKS